MSGADAQNEAGESVEDDTNAPAETPKPLVPVSIRKRIAARASAFERWLLQKLCWALWVDIAIDEVTKQRCIPHATQGDDPGLPSVASGVVFEQAMRTLDAAEKRQEAVREKGKNLLPLLAVVASLVTLSVGFFGHGYGLLAPVVFALATIVLHQEVLALGWSAFPKIDRSLFGVEEAEQRARLTTDYLAAARFIDARTDYMTQVLTAARRSAGLTLCAIVVVSSFYFAGGRQQDADALIGALRRDRALINELRGPKGDVGVAGPAGSQGPKGDTGPSGPPGRRAERAHGEGGKRGADRNH